MLDLPAHILGILEEADLDTPEKIVSAGQEALEALDRIGPKTAAHILNQARASLEAAEGIVPEGIAPAATEPEPAPEPEEERGDGGAPTRPEPDPRPRTVRVRLVGRKAAVIGTRAILEGEVLEVLYPHYEAALAYYPAGTFETVG